MNRVPLSRRRFLGTGVGAAIAATAASRPDVSMAAVGTTHRDNARLRFASIGVGIRGQGLLCEASYFASCAAICDADSEHLQSAARKLDEHYRSKSVRTPVPDLCEDYRRVLERPDIDVVVIATPDHWHAKIAIEALRAGKDVYCEKPLTLTVAEGREIIRAANESGHVMAVGTQQRSGKLFQTAAALVRSGRLGAIKRITCGLDGAPSSPSLPTAAPSTGLNWNRWLGPAPYVAYREGARAKSGYGAEFPQSRAHAHFRWWYEYSGGKLTDWGAHHVDIAMWALCQSHGSLGPYRVEPIVAEHPVEFVDGMPTDDSRFNTATRFHVRVTFPDDVELDIRHSAKEDLGFGNGIMFEGEAGRFLVNRSKIVGKPVEELEVNPLPDDSYRSLHPAANAKGMWHMKNFFDSVTGESTPISDVESHHRHLTVCHVANIAMRLGRTLVFDPVAERFVNDAQADGFLVRKPRDGFNVVG